MADFICKCCGAALNVQLGKSTVKCEYCGVTQALPRDNDDIAANQFNRATDLRIKGEFDKAEAIYENLAASYPNESEAYWGIVLCRYGIIYETASDKNKKLPTCNRTVEKSIRSDDDYRSALEYADDEQRKIYESEAAEIDRLQSAILDIVRNEAPYDIFISYKRTDENGERTVDSLLADELYRRFTKEGYKVFYAEVTLESKLGKDYEPYIYAALATSKVMLAVGTKPEYFNAVWVKNEWSRFLKMTEKDPSKRLIPCYKDMNAYDLPEELIRFQAKDMSKIGYDLELLRFVEDLFAYNKRSSSAKAAPSAAKPAENKEQLLKRVEIFLRDGDWGNADRYCEKILDMDPECYQAYLGKLMAKVNCHNISELKEIEVCYLDEPSFKNALRYGKEADTDELKEAACDSAYRQGKNMLEIASSQSDIDQAIGIMLLLTEYDYKDSRQIYDGRQNLKNEFEYNRALAIMDRAKTSEEYISAGNTFKGISGYKNSDAKAKECFRRSTGAKAKRIGQKLKLILFFILDFVVPVLLFAIINAVLRLDYVDKISPFAAVCSSVLLGAVTLICNFQSGYLYSHLDLDVSGCLVKGFYACGNVLNAMMLFLVAPLLAIGGFLMGTVMFIGLGAVVIGILASWIGYKIGG